jgi:heat shock protein 1/8
MNLGSSIVNTGVMGTPVLPKLEVLASDSDANVSVPLPPLTTLPSLEEMPTFSAVNKVSMKKDAPIPISASQEEISQNNYEDEYNQAEDDPVYLAMLAKEEEDIRRILGITATQTNLPDAPYDVLSQPTVSQKKLMEEEEDDIVIGIDLGTTCSSVAIWRKGKVEILADEYGTTNFPSVVSFGYSQSYIGNEAKKQIELNPANTFHNIKRIIGRNFEDAIVKMEIPYLSYTVGNDDGRIILPCKYRPKLYPEEVSAIMLMHLKEVATKRLGKPVKRAVITIPAMFNDAQRTATKMAAKIAGLECLRLLHEPTAAALAYGILQRDRKEMMLLVYDFGGGTLDVNLMNYNTTTKLAQVLATAGNTHLGGEDFDYCIVEYCYDRFKKTYGYDNLHGLDIVQKQILKQRCERAKCHLSSHDKAEITVRNFYRDQDLKVTLTRSIFEQICKELFIVSMKPIDDVMRSCEFQTHHISEIILVGGSTRIPRVVENLRNYFGKEPNTTIDPELAVSMGASILAYTLTHTDDPHISSVQLLERCQLSLGVGMGNGTMAVVIPRDTIMPFRQEKRFSTDTDNMTSLTIPVYEGERKLSKDNRLLGSFTIEGIDPSPRGIPQIIVEFSIDVNCILEVSARDARNADTNNKMRISGNRGAIRADEVERLVKEAEECMLTDNLKYEIASLRYEIEDLCDTIIENVDDTDCSMKSTDKELVKTDTSRILEHLKDLKQEHTVDVSVYQDLSKKLKKKYGTLVLRRNKNSDTVEGTAVQSDKNGVGATVYNDDRGLDFEGRNEHTVLTDELIEDQIIQEELTEEEKIKVITLRQQLMDMITQLTQALAHTNLSISKEHKEELTNVVEDAKTWVYTVEHSTPADYEIKLRELNTRSNEIISQYETSFTYAAATISQEQQLKDTCYALRSMLREQAESQIILSRAGTKVLDEAVTETLEWLLTSEERGETISELDCANKLANINDLTTRIHEAVHEEVSRDGVVGHLNDPSASSASADNPNGIMETGIVSINDL